MSDLPPNTTQPAYSQFSTTSLFSNMNSPNNTSMFPPLQQQPQLAYAGLPQTNPLNNGMTPDENRLFTLMQHAMKPLESKIDKIHDELLNRVTSLETRVGLIEKGDDTKNTEISRIKDTMINMQHALNSIDSKKRSKNIIIAGLPEDDITTNHVLYSGDDNKIAFLLEKMGLDTRLVDDDATKIERLGNDTSGFKRRFTKIEFTDKTTRENVMKEAPKLKDLPEPWNKVYFNRDTHPVYQKEHKRLRKKFNELKGQGNPDSVKLTKGILTVEGVTVDKNIFLN